MVNAHTHTHKEKSSFKEILEQQERERKVEMECVVDCSSNKKKDLVKEVVERKCDNHGCQRRENPKEGTYMKSVK